MIATRIWQPSLRVRASHPGDCFKTRRGSRLFPFTLCLLATTLFCLGVVREAEGQASSQPARLASEMDTAEMNSAEQGAGGYRFNEEGLSQLRDDERDSSVDDSAGATSTSERSTGSASATGAQLALPITSRSRGDQLPGGVGGAGGGGFQLPTQAFRNTAISLGLVLALFLVVAWFLRKTQPRGGGALPTEAVDVLGRVALSPKQQLQLIRLGTKLLLVADTGGRLQTLGEVSEPSEVDHLLQLCQSRQKGSSSEDFRRVLAQFERDGAQGFLESGESSQGAPARRRRAWMTA